MGLRIVFACAVALGLCAPAFAQSAITSSARPRVIESYVAFIGADDLYNSSGNRLTKPWQIIRQDRANYHAYGIRQRGDTSDSFFADPKNRQRMENMLATGMIANDAGRAIVQGGVLIRVDIMGRNGRGELINVTVL